MIKEIFFKTVVISFNVDGKEYYTFGNYDSALSDNTNIDNAMQNVQKAIGCKGMLECHIGEERVFCNLNESRDIILRGGRIAKLYGSIDV